MLKKVLAMMLFVAAVIAGASVVTMDSESDLASAEESEMRSGIPQPMGGMDCGPMPSEQPFFHRGDMRMSAPAPGPMPGMLPMDMANERQPMVHMGPQPPEYNHDATPEDFEKMIPIMVDDDISRYDPGFVEDAIDFARENGMADAADILSKKLQDYLATAQVLNDICTMDTRASGLEEDAEDEPDQITVEDAPEEDPVVFTEVDEAPQKQFFKPVSSPIQVNLQLDL